MGGFGQVPRDQRSQELEYYLNKQYNSIGLRLQTKLNSIEKQFTIQDTDTEVSPNSTNTVTTESGPHPAVTSNKS